MAYNSNKIKKAFLPEKLFKWIGCKAIICAVVEIAARHKGIFVGDAMIVVCLAPFLVGKQLVCFFDLYKFRLSHWIVVFIRMPVSSINVSITLLAIAS